MPRLMFSVILWLGAVACGPDCSKDDLDGTYLVMTTERSGTCGDMGDFVSQMNHGESTQEPGCTPSYSRWSDDECTNEASGVCTGTADNIRTEATGSLTQKDDDGERFEGVIEFTIKDATTGETLCISTYDLEYERQ